MWIFPVGNYLDIHKTGSVVPTLSKPCLQLLDICQTFQHPPLPSSGRTVANETCVAPSLSAAVTLQTQLSQRLLKQFLLIDSCRDMAENLASDFHRLPGWFKNVYSQSYECWMMGTYRTQSEWSEQNADVPLCWQILSLNDLGVHWWNILRLLQQYTPLRFGGILIIFLWRQRIAFLPNSGHTCCQLRLWNSC